MSDRPLGIWWVLAAGLVVGLILVWDDHLRRGGYAMAASLVLAAVLRLVLPKAAAGSLVVRSRVADVVVMLALAAVLASVVSVLDMRPRGPGSVNGLASGGPTTSVAVPAGTTTEAPTRPAEAPVAQVG